LKWSVAAGWASSGVSAVVALAVIPVQLRYLGAEAYGLIGFCITLQSMLMVLDMGMTATVNREVARCTSRDDRLRVAGLVGAMDWVCWFLALACAAAIAASAPQIASRWLNVVHLPRQQVTQALMIAGFLIAARWPVTLYQSALLGEQRVVLNSVINLGAVTVSAAAGVAAITLISPDVRWFMASQLAVGVLHLLVLRHGVRRLLLGSTGWTSDFSQIRRVWRFSALTGLVTVVGVCFMQMDKLILSNLLTLEQLGHYSLAAVVASGIYVVTMPVFNVVYPRFSALLAAGREDELERLYRFMSHLLAALLAPTGLVIALFSRDLLQAWTGNAELTARVAPITSLLVLGSALHGIMFMPFALALARGEAGLALKINVLLLIFVGPLILAGALVWNATGAAAAWLLLHSVYLVAGSYATHRALLPRLRFRWLLQDVAVPLTWSCGVSLLGAQLATVLEMNLAARVAFAGVVWLACIMTTLASSAVLRQWGLQRLAAFEGKQSA
jgi:O-antigen/teichoic acid export membrane protein